MPTRWQESLLSRLLMSLKEAACLNVRALEGGLAHPAGSQAPATRINAFTATFLCEKGSTKHTVVIIATMSCNIFRLPRLLLYVLHCCCSG